MESKLKVFQTLMWFSPAMVKQQQALSSYKLVTLNGMAASLGDAEINFLKHTSTELADLWVSLEGRLAQSSQSKLRLRIFLDNNKRVELNLRSPQKNSTFQKLFGLPPEEFLVSDFTCQLRRKLPVRGRLFLFARIVGFYANLFGRKTKFFFLWEDIADIQVLPPSLASVGSPSLVIVLRKGRGLDARHGANSQDEEGRLRFYFQSFVSFNVASRTIMALWRTITLASDRKAENVEEQQDQEESPIILESVLDARDAKMSKVYTAELSLCVNSGLIDPYLILVLFIFTHLGTHTSQLFLGSTSTRFIGGKYMLHCEHH
ncbi:hypothetical protein DITRI_Ditri17bG0059800 [Diplodiscus trichospermus]